MRSDNISMLQDTLSILEKGFYQINEETIHLKLSRTQMEEVEVVSCDAKHDQHDEYEQGHDARRTQAPLEETHDAEFEDNQPHGKQETPVEIKTSPGTDVEHEVSTEAGDDNSPYDKELNLIEEGCDLQCGLYREVGSFRLTT